MTRQGLIGALAILLAMLVAAPAHASFPGKNGRVAFSTATGSPPGNIFTMSATGRNRHRLTRRGDSRNPAWSRDGSRIAFDRQTNGRRALYVMSARGSRPRRIPTGRVQAENPTWSPNGRRIAFQGCRGSGHCKATAIFVVRASGGGLKRITPNGSDPVWSPNGRWIAYHGKVRRKDPCATLARVRPSGRGRRAILSRRQDSHNVCSRGGAGADFSPNGRRLVYYGLHPMSHQDFPSPTGGVIRVWQYDPAMYTVGVNGKRKRRLMTRSLESGEFFALPFIWSPEGDELLWRDDRGAFIANTRARKARRLHGMAGVGYSWQRLPR